MSLKTFARPPVVRALAAAAVGIGLGAAAPKPGEYVAFVTCPLLRDTPELPCWMARNDGTLYYLGIQEGRKYASTWYQPQMKHKMLVEGVVSDRAKICGGVPLDKMQVSDLPEVSPECNRRLPTRGHVSPKGRPTGPDPAEVTGQTVLLGPPAGAPEHYSKEDVAARRNLRFDIHYNFDSDNLIYPQEHNRIVQAQEYAKAIKAKRIRITALRGASRLSDGSVLEENPAVVSQRRANLLEILSAFEIPAEMVASEVRTIPEPAKGEGDHLNRRVEIEIVP